MYILNRYIFLTIKSTNFKEFLDFEEQVLEKNILKRI